VRHQERHHGSSCSLDSSSRSTLLCSLSPVISSLSAIIAVFFSHTPFLVTSLVFQRALLVVLIDSCSLKITLVLPPALLYLLFDVSFAFGYARAPAGCHGSYPASPAFSLRAMGILFTPSYSHSFPRQKGRHCTSWSLLYSGQFRQVIFLVPFCPFLRRSFQFVAPSFLFSSIYRLFSLVFFARLFSLMIPIIPSVFLHGFYSPCLRSSSFTPVLTETFFLGCRAHLS